MRMHLSLTRLRIPYTRPARTKPYAYSPQSIETRSFVAGNAFCVSIFFPIATRYAASSISAKVRNRRRAAVRGIGAHGALRMMALRENVRCFQHAFSRTRFSRFRSTLFERHTTAASIWKFCVTRRFAKSFLENGRERDLPIKKSSNQLIKEGIRQLPIRKGVAAITCKEFGPGRDREQAETPQESRSRAGQAS